MDSKNINVENSRGYQKNKALLALAKAKKIERKQLKNGKSYQRLDHKTFALR